MIELRELYTAWMLIATFVAVMLIKRQQQTLAIAKSQKIGIAIGGLIGATFAAKLPFLLGADPADGVLSAWLGDGKTVLWGLVGGYLGVELAKWATHVTTSTGDTFVIPVAVAIAIGRLGCFFYGCCYGVATNQEWGVRFANAPDAGTILRHPAQLYEVMFHMSFALVAWTAIGRPGDWPRLRGNWMPIYMIAYATFRFVSEYWRPEVRVVAGLTFYQISSLIIACGFAILLAVRTMRPSPRRARATA